MKSLKQHLALLLAATMLGSIGGVALADTMAIVPTGLSTTPDPRDYTTGWAFTTSDSLSVTALGYLDVGGDGLNGSHDVGIFDLSGNLLVSTTVPSGTVGSLDGDYRFMAISPFDLAAGSYVIGGLNLANASDDIAFGASSFNPAPQITVDNTRLFTFGSTLAFPTAVGNVYPNPNFQFTSALTVPEPGCVTLLGLALAGLLGVSSRRRAGQLVG